MFLPVGCQFTPRRPLCLCLLSSLSPCPEPPFPFPRLSPYLRCSYPPLLVYFLLFFSSFPQSSFFPLSFFPERKSLAPHKSLIVELGPPTGRVIAPRVVRCVLGNVNAVAAQGTDAAPVACAATQRVRCEPGPGSNGRYVFLPLQRKWRQRPRSVPNTALPLFSGRGRFTL